MRNIIKKLKELETHHKIAAFILILVTTTLITRAFVFLHDPNPILMGFEIHHFDYGLIILMLINIFLVLGKKRTAIFLPILAISTGLILEDISYIRLNINTANIYAQSFLSVPIISGVLVVAALLIVSIYKMRKNRN